MFIAIFGNECPRINMERNHKNVDNTLRDLVYEKGQDVYSQVSF